MVSSHAGGHISNARVKTYLTTLVASLCVGLVDFVTGVDVRVTALYFLPLAYAGHRLGRPGAAVASLFSVVAWLVAFWGTAPGDVPVYVFVIDFFTQGTAFLVVALLVARLAELLEQARESSRKDALTGLNSRPAFVEQAGVALALCKRHMRPVTLAFIDLDHFKRVNDSAGHARGDRLLQAFGTALAGSLRASDIGARFGGDEFVVLLPETGPDDGPGFCEQLQAKLDAVLGLSGFGVTTSIGVAIDAKATVDLDTLLAHADAQMYDGKRGATKHFRVRLLDPID